jgi:uncharacterized protein involved in exopolysaccharide biosynthesis
VYIELEARRLKDSLRVRAVGLTRVIELTAESTSPDLAAAFLNELCAEYIAKNIKARNEMGQHTSRSLARLLGQERARLPPIFSNPNAYERRSPPWKRLFRMKSEM